MIRYDYDRAAAKRSERIQAAQVHLPRYLAILLLFIVLAGANRDTTLVRPSRSDRELLGCQFNSVDDLIERARAGSVRVLDRTGWHFLASPGKQYFAPVVRVDELPEYVLEALVAQEDRRFYQHKGNDWLGIARAVLMNLRALGVLQGGSSITSQAIGLSCFGHLGPWGRRIAEIIVSPEAETVLTKIEIATLYLNVAYFGSGAFGIEAASRVFFGKGAADLTLAETILIIQALPQPSMRNVRKNIDLARKHAHVLLNQMLEQGFINKAEATRAKRASPQVQKAKKPSGVQRQSHPHLGYFGQYVFEHLPKASNVEAPRTVVSTMNLHLQEQVVHFVNEMFKNAGRSHRIGQVAVAVADFRTGEILAYIGGRNFNQSQFDRVTDAKRQGGSTLKILAYGVAIAQGLRAETFVLDAPTAVNDHSIRNADSRSHGRISVADAFARSLNTIPVALVSSRAAAMQHFADQLGLDVKLTPSPIAALGVDSVSPIRLLEAFGTVANLGRRMVAVPIIEVRNGGSVNRVCARHSAGRQVISPIVAAELAKLLRRAVAVGTGRIANFSPSAAGKTGTTTDGRDAWFVGFDAQHVAVVWLGNDDGRPMRDVTGGGLAARLWTATMRAAGKFRVPPRCDVSGPEVVAIVGPGLR